MKYKKGMIQSNSQGICSKPCKLGKLQKQIAELKAKITKEKEVKN